jgi:hypothetical protein
MASRKDEKERLRREREERERAAAEGARRRRLIGYGVGGALALAAVIAIAVVAIAGAGGGGAGDESAPRAEAEYPTAPIPPQRESDLAKAARAAGCTVRSSPSEGRGHTEGQVEYRTNPPTSGSHNPVPADDGVYAESPGNEHLVHSLEHGRIVLQFRPSIPERVKGQLKSLFDEDPYHTILSPNHDMPYAVAATAWTELLACPEANDRIFDALRAFKQRNRDRGPEFVP